MTMKMTLSEFIGLKRCPFCGGEARHYAPGPVEHHVECVDCYADIKRDSEFEAIEAWNTRAERTCHNMSHRLDESRFHCSECWFGCWVKDVSDGRDKLPNYCPSCGAKVVER